MRVIHSAVTTGALVVLGAATPVVGQSANLLTLQNPASVDRLVADSSGALLLRGVNGVGTAINPGTGSFMLWYPRKSAFRAGRATITQFDDASIGARSIALGDNVIASATGSFSLGTSSTSSGIDSYIFGKNNSIPLTVQDGYVVGRQNTLTGGSGPGVFGAGNTVGAGDGYAFGTTNTVTGGGGYALGNSNDVSGAGATAIGHANTSSGFRSMAIGRRNIASGAGSFALGSGASTNSQIGAFVYGDSSTSTLVTADTANQFVIRAQQLWIGKAGNLRASNGVSGYIETSTGAFLSPGGTWTNASDRNRKHDFLDVAGEDVLARLRSLPIGSWSYRDEPREVRHLGPMAQDFRAAFGLGGDSVSIATVDADGVALAAAQALERRSRAQEEALRAAHEENAALRASLDELRAQMAALAARLDQRDRAQAQPR